MDVLIIDDNDRYANNLIQYFQEKKVSTTRAFTAKEGFEIYSKDKNKFHTIITDITMESQTSGLFMIRKIYKDGYKGNLIIATTGFDAFGVMTFSKYFLPPFAGIGWMIPKVPLKQGKVLFYPTSLKKNIAYEDLIK